MAKPATKLVGDKGPLHAAARLSSLLKVYEGMPTLTPLEI